VSRLGLLLTPAAAVIGALLGRAFGTWAAVVLALLLGSAVAAFTEARQQRHVSRLAADVNALMGQAEHQQVRLGGAGAWQQLAVALNALGASYARRGQRLDAATPTVRDLVGSLTGAALVFGPDGHLLAANARAREHLGIPDVASGELTPAQALGSSALVGAVREARESSRPVHVDAEVRGRDLTAVASVLGQDVLVLVHDRTRERRVETLRRDFVVNASHELKTPVTSIQTLGEALEVVLSQVGERERAGELVRRLREESERLAALVHDLLDLRRLEEGAPLEVVPVDVAHAVREVVEEITEEADGLGVTIALHLPDSAVVAAAKDDVALVVRNLVRNAVQYNRPDGVVSIEVRAADGFVEIDVRDTGIGMAQADVPRIFERFYRVDVARSRETGGTGLGLSIVRHAVEGYGGTIRVVSLLGEGSTFTVRLPVDPDRDPRTRHRRP